MITGTLGLRSRSISARDHGGQLHRAGLECPQRRAAGGRMDWGGITGGAGAAAGTGGGGVCPPHRLRHRRGRRRTGGPGPRGTGPRGPGRPEPGPGRPETGQAILPGRATAACTARVPAHRARRRGSRRPGRGRSRGPAAPAAGSGQPRPARGDHRLGHRRARLRLPAVDQARHPQRRLRVQRGPARRARLHAARLLSTAGSTPSSTRSSSPASTPRSGGWPRGSACTWTTSMPTRRTPARRTTGSGSTAGSGRRPR